jgi:protease IV
MLSLLVSQALALLVAPLLWIVRAITGWMLGRRGVVEVELTNDGPRGRTLESHIAQLVALRRVADTPDVRAVLVRIRSPRLGWAMAQELQQELAGIRKAGKLLTAYMEVAGNLEMYLAAPADRIWMAPASELALVGVGARLTFFGGSFERVGVYADIESAGAYKSFGESYTRKYPTPENREAVAAVVGDLHDQLVSGILAWRKIGPDAIARAMEEAPIPAEQAKALGLVDGLAFPDQVRTSLDELLGGEQKVVPLHRVSFWLNVERWLARIGTRHERVAVVHLEGAVTHGVEPTAGSGPRIAAERVVPALDALREDPRVKAVVLYVDSPGGSALASDLIAREVARLQSVKPVISVFGDVAASGGYYIAAPSAELIAQEGTLTGSIGVVGGKIVFGEAAERLGVSSEAITVGPNATVFSPWEPFTPQQRARFRQSLERIYDRFVQVVAAGRKTPAEAIESVAQGRVWTGRQALGHGLVDRIGGLDLAIRRARELAGFTGSVSTVHIRFPPPRFRLLASLLGNRGAVQLVEPWVASRLGKAADAWMLIVRHPAEPMAILPWIWEDPP